MMEKDDGLDEDFIHYLEYAHKYADKLRERAHLELGKTWLKKLMEVPRSVPEKRNRNIFLSRLVLAMQSGELEKPFLRPPPLGPLPNAFQIFGPPQPEIEEEEAKGDDVCALDTAYVSKDGRMYVATKSLGRGQGALTYMGVSVANASADGQDCPSDVFNAHFAVPKRAAFTVTSARPEEVMQLRGGAKTESWSDTTCDTMSLCEYYTAHIRNIDDYLGGKGALTEDVQDLAKGLSGQQKDYVDDDNVVELRNVLTRRLQSVHQLTQRLNSLTENSEQRLDPRVFPPDEHFQKIWSEVATDELLTENVQALEKMYTTLVKNRFLDIQKKQKLSLVEKCKESVKKEWMDMCSSHQQQIKHIQDKIQTANNILQMATKDLEMVRASDCTRNAGKGEVGDQRLQEDRLMLQQLSNLFNDYKAEQEEVDRLEQLVLAQSGKLSKLASDERFLNDSNCAIMSEIRKTMEAQKS